MINMLKRPMLFFVLLSILAGAVVPFVFNVPVGLSQAEATPTPFIVQAPPDATPTPTPFRPLPPTPAIYPTNTPTPTELPTATPTETSVVDAYISGEQLDELPGRINILLLGADQRPWQKGKRFRTDTIIMATINKEAGTLSLTSFPRDLWVNIPGYGQDRINTAYQYGGFQLLAQTFKENFGVKPQHYVLINFFNFKQFVDQLQGLDVKVGQELSDYRNGYWVTIPKGMVHMDADTVLWYVRSRKTSNDFARNKRQQEVLEALIDEVLTFENIGHLPELYDIYDEMVTTDLGLGDILPMVPVVAKFVGGKNIVSYYIGPNQVSDWITPGGAMVLLPNYDLIRKTIRKSQGSP